MASRGNNEGGGCLTAIVVFFVLFFLPAWVTGDSFGWGVLIGWWIILGLICFAIFQAISPSNNTDSSTVQRLTVSDNPQSTISQNNSESNTVSSTLRVGTKNINKSLVDGYQAKIKLREKYEEDIEALKKEQRQIDDKVTQLQKKKFDLREGVEKPFFTSMKKWLILKQPEIEELDTEISNLQQNYYDKDKEIDQITNKISAVKYNIYDDTNSAFEKLKDAFEIIKTSCNIEGMPNLKNSAIDSKQRCQDLKYIQYKTNPYGLLFDNLRFYFFPNGIWVFEGNGKLAGVFKPKAINGLLTTRENDKLQYYSFYFKKPRIYDDTKIIKKDIPHDTWLYTCRDGTPDLRYRYNPKQTYYTQQDYYVECSLEIELCECKFNYAVSSFDNCELLEKAIISYSKNKENKDMIPILLDLLNRCEGEDQNIKKIQEEVATY